MAKVIPLHKPKETILEEAVLPKNTREEYRMSVVEYKGYRLFKCRVWFRDVDGQMKPGIRNRLTLRVDKWDEWVRLANRVIGGSKENNE